MSEIVKKLNQLCDDSEDDCDAVRQFVNHRVKVNGNTYTLVGLLNKAGIDISVESSGETPNVFLGFC